MEALYLLIPLSVVIVFIAIWIFLRASDTGQFDDMVGPAMRILQDDDHPDSKQDDHGKAQQSASDNDGSPRK